MSFKQIANSPMVLAGEYYRVPADNRDLNYDKYYSKGSTKVVLKEYNSFNTHRLSETELKILLAQINIK